MKAGPGGEVQPVALTGEEAGRVKASVRLSSLEYAPVAQGQVVGEAALSLDGEELCRIPLVSQEYSPERPREKSWLDKILDALH